MSEFDKLANTCYIQPCLYCFLVHASLIGLIKFSVTSIHTSTLPSKAEALLQGANITKCYSHVVVMLPPVMPVCQLSVL